MRREHFLQSTSSATKNEVVMGADANTETRTGSFWSLSYAVPESTGGLVKKENVKIFPNSPIATMSAAERKEDTVTFRLPNASTTVSFTQNGNSLIATFTSRFYQPFSVKLPQRISERKQGRCFDLDYTIQLLARAYLGENTSNGSNESAIRYVWRNFRAYTRHRK